LEALYQSFDPEKVRFLSCDFWNGSDAQCDLFQNVSGTSYPVLLNASGLGAPGEFNCSYHYVFVIDGDGIVAYRGSVNIPALEIVIEDAVTRLSQVAVGDTPRSDLQLGANYPNPFNPSTTIPYLVPDGRDGARVNLDVLDLRGRIVRSLVAANHAAGSYEATFDGRNDRGDVLPSGSYLARLRVDGQESARVMTLVK